jgi:hypothetical protein
MSAVWGTPTWIFFHTLADHISEESFNTIGSTLINIIERICRHLPCPECREHAALFWSHTNKNSIKTPQDLRNVLFVFHNRVNQRKHKPLFQHDQLMGRYRDVNIIMAYMDFIKHFHTRGNMNLIGDAFHRDRMLIHLKMWFKNNAHHFFVRKEMLE